MALVVVVSLLALPYLVDVGYMEDHTPTHSAQEILSDEDDTAEGEQFLVFTDELNHPAEIESIDLHASFGSFHPDRFLDRTVAPFQHLSIAPLISRPPPLV
jgi:hypothetical protein